MGDGGYLGEGCFFSIGRIRGWEDDKWLVEFKEWHGVSERMKGLTRLLCFWCKSRLITTYPVVARPPGTC